MTSIDVVSSSMSLSSMLSCLDDGVLYNVRRDGVSCVFCDDSGVCTGVPLVAVCLRGVTNFLRDFCDIGDLKRRFNGVNPIDGFVFKLELLLIMLFVLLILLVCCKFNLSIN